MPFYTDRYFPADQQDANAIKTMLTKIAQEAEAISGMIKFTLPVSVIDSGSRVS